MPIASMLPDLLSPDLSQDIKLGFPLILLEGRHDRVTNADVAHDWVERVQAPEKHFIRFEDSSHEPEFDEPGRKAAAAARRHTAIG
jgi:proline iminopeptidase